MNLYKKCTEKPYCFLVIDTALASDTASRLRKNLSERIKKLLMTIKDKTRDRKLQYGINREAANTSEESRMIKKNYVYLISKTTKNN